MKYLPLNLFILGFFLIYIYLGSSPGGNVISLTVTPEILLSMGANYAPLTWYKEEWRLFTFPFLHSSLLHLVINMSALWFLWTRSALIFSTVNQFFIFFFCSAVAGWFSSMFQTDMVQIGAGSGIFGLLGAIIGWSVSRNHIKIEIRTSFAWYPALVLVILLTMGWFLPNINQYANISASVAGIFLGSVLSSKSENEPFFTKFLVLVGVTILLATGGWLFTKPNYSELVSSHRQHKIQEIVQDIESVDSKIESKMSLLWSELLEHKNTEQLVEWQKKWNVEVIEPLNENFKKADNLIIYKHEQYYPLVKLLQTYTSLRLQESEWLYNPKKVEKNINTLQSLRQKILDIHSNIREFHSKLDS